MQGIYGSMKMPEELPMMADAAVRALHSISFVTVVLFAVCGSLLLGCGAVTPEGPQPSAVPSFRNDRALVYVERKANNIQVMWRAFTSPERHVLYRSKQEEQAPDIPAEFGFLPSPGGRWVLVWDVIRDPSPRAVVTQW